MSEVEKFFGRRGATSPKTPRQAKSKTKQGSPSPVINAKSKKRRKVISSSEEESDPENPIPVPVRKKFQPSVGECTAAASTVLSRGTGQTTRKETLVAGQRKSPRKVTKTVVTETFDITVQPEDSASQEPSSLGKKRHGVTVQQPVKKSIKSDAAIKKVGKSAAVTKKEETLKPISITDFFANASTKDGSNTTKKPAKAKVESEQHSDKEFRKLLQDEDGLSKSSSGSKRSSSRNASPQKTVQAGEGTKMSKKTPEKSPVTASQPAVNHSPSSQSNSKTTISPKKSKPNSSKKEAKVSSPGDTEVKASGSENGASMSAEKTKGFNYRQFVQRERPQALGTREIPQGESGCMIGLTIVITGVLESIERDVVEALVKDHGGRITHSVSGKTSYLVAGRDAGPAKLEKAKKCKVKIIGEEEFYRLVETLPGKKGAAGTSGSNKRKESIEPSPEPKVRRNLVPEKDLFPEETTASVSIHGNGVANNKVQAAGAVPDAVGKGVTFKDTVPWVEKYKPQTLKQMVGQQGEKSCLNKLITWLKNWEKWNFGDSSKGPKKAPGGYNRSDDGSNFKAALLSGPPGIGKTTSAHMACKELGLKFMEFNASDTRNKKSLNDSVAESIFSQSVNSYFEDNTAQRKRLKPNRVSHVLIMDEIDGMSGSDRGGIPEMIQFIKKSQVPIICICNDRQHQKIRNLANYCFDLRFQRPRLEAIRGAMMSVVFKEGLKLKPSVLDQVIEASHHDIRQVLHNLNLIANQSASQLHEGELTKQIVEKDIVANPFEIGRLMFTENERTRKMNFNEKLDLFFFTDYSLMGLFAQENYLTSAPSKAKTNLQRMQCIAESAEMIAQGDVTERQIRNSGAWNLLPVQGLFSVLLPSEIMKGHMSGMVQFPGWFGKNSRFGKNVRLTQQLEHHMGLHIYSDSQGLIVDYLPMMRNSILSSLKNERSQEAIDLLNAYDLSREDLDSILELTKWGEKGDLWSMIPSKAKAAFTRAYNKSGHSLPYSMGLTEITGLGAKKRKKKAQTVKAEEFLDEEGNLVSDEEGENEDESDDDEVSVMRKPEKKARAVPKKGKAGK